MDYKELKDSYSKLLEAVNELASEGRILVVKNKDGAPRVLFWNDQRYNTAMDQGNQTPMKKMLCLIHVVIILALWIERMTDASFALSAR